ncbi:MinD superfamily P-loop ATPase [Methanococcus maripaludis]|uniref:MinD superfamily P-loop ATPase n=1 Tax=Methanococcus maripaludis TaxID=39152 RepID=A0A7J9S4A0_METMI|nr:ATP-binding protein [Methanococcus maripaludis]MBB6401621.1 MinD superfamily P-loop ATPase [Methanococcus maripaludis]
MKQIVIISGKGGTGKTTISSSFSELMDKKNIADCDVEAPNLHLMFENEIINTKEYIGSQTAVIDPEKCIKCEKCLECRFDAITPEIKVNSLKCEGCGLCEYVCPVDAVKMVDNVTGHVYSCKIKDGYLSYAKLNIGAEGAGKVVTEVRKNSLENQGFENLLIDGSPGIGCVVIASLTGCDYAVVVTEPTTSGLDDLSRVLELTQFFDIQSYVIINKYDINEEKTSEIIDYCKKSGFEILGKVPFDSTVNKAIQNEIPIVNYDCPAGNEIKRIWNDFYDKLK